MSIDRSTLEAKPREGSGKGPARRLRASGLVPAVVYGRHLDKPAHLAIDPKAVKTAINTPHRFNTLINLKVSGGAERQVLLKDYQQDPVSRAILHVDFVEVRENEQVKVNVPVVLVGKAVGTLEGGILNQVRRDIEVYALPSAIPEKIEVDVTNLKIAQALHINEVKLPAGISIKSHVNYTIAVVGVPEKEEVAVVAAPVAGAAVPGAPAAAAGAAPAADAKAGDAKAGDKAAAPAKAPAKK
jgi:large subunit ribosomal protein L25